MTRAGSGPATPTRDGPAFCRTPSSAAGVPPEEQLALALRRQPDAFLQLRLRGAANRLLEGAEAEPRPEGTADVDRVHPDPVGIREPEWQLHPRADLVLLQELVRDPRDVGA